MTQKIELDLLAVIDGKAYRAGELPDGRIVYEKYLGDGRYEFPIVEPSMVSTSYAYIDSESAGFGVHRFNQTGDVI